MIELPIFLLAVTEPITFMAWLDTSWHYLVIAGMALIMFRNAFPALKEITRPWRTEVKPLDDIIDKLECIERQIKDHEKDCSYDRKQTKEALDRIETFNAEHDKQIKELMAKNYDTTSELRERLAKVEKQ